MIEEARLLEPGFSVADAEYPSLSLRDESLVLEFKDHSQRVVRVRLARAAGVKWQELDSPGPEDRNDSIYEILNSFWLQQYYEQSSRSADDRLRHFRLCFNGSGVLDVLAASMDLDGGSTPQQR